MKDNREKEKNNCKILQWHPAFFAGLQIEFEDEKNKLIFEREYNLGTKPMQIDVIIIKKYNKSRLSKNIGNIFKKYNIFEYKSPSDYLSINDYYKVYGYAYFYKSATTLIDEIKITELTITFVCRHYPRELIEHIKKVRGLAIEKYCNGIYYILNDVLVTQLIVTSELLEEENFWLYNLTNDIGDVRTIERLSVEYSKHEHNELYKSVMNVIIRANKQKFEEVKYMCEALKELFADELEMARNEGIKCMIESSKECGGSWEKVLQLVMGKYLVNKEQAEEFMKLYW